jgi:secreted trypsin-like serine protease
MHRLPLLAFAALALALALACASAARADVRPRIVHGSDAAITDYPFQVALFLPTSSGTPFDTQYCGGVIVDQTHVITAAHCLYDLTVANQVADPADIKVLAGTDTLSSGGTQFTVAQTSFDPQYDPSINDFDLGIITVADPLWTDGTPPPLDGTHSIAPVPLMTDDSVFETDLTGAANAIVTGWGDTQLAPPDDFPDHLQKANVPLVPTAQCKADYEPDTPITPRLFCAGDGPDPITDSCQGDSGGPIVIGADPSSYMLVGLVDSGNGCADAGFPGIYDRISNADFQDFLASDPPQAPEQVTPVTMTAGNAPGQTLTCTSDPWEPAGPGAPALMYQFLTTAGTALTPESPDGTSYTIQTSDYGKSIVCQVQAKNAGGYGFGRSAPRFVPTPTPVPPTPPPPAPPKLVDSKSPKLHVRGKKCTKRTCTIKVRVTDPSPSSGIKRLKATLNYRRMIKCKSRKHKHCHKRAHRALRPKAGKSGTFTIVARHLKPGTGYTVTLLPFDKAGNRPAFSTITSVRTKKLHPFFLF